MTSESFSDNASLMPADANERRKAFGPTITAAEAYASAEIFEDLNEGRFEIIPTNAIHENSLEELYRLKKKKRNAQGIDTPDTAGEKEEETPYPSSQRQAKSDNYQHICLDDPSNAKEENTEGQHIDELHRLSKAEAAVSARRQKEEQRVRRQRIKDDIQFWRDQIGQGLYEDAVINVTINNLQRNLAE